MVQHSIPELFVAVSHSLVATAKSQKQIRVNQNPTGGPQRRMRRHLHALAQNVPALEWAKMQSTGSHRTSHYALYALHPQGLLARHSPFLEETQSGNKHRIRPGMKECSETSTGLWCCFYTSTGCPHPPISQRVSHLSTNIPPLSIVAVGIMHTRFCSK